MRVSLVVMLLTMSAVACSVEAPQPQPPTLEINVRDTVRAGTSAIASLQVRRPDGTLDECRAPSNFTSSDPTLLDVNSVGQITVHATFPIDVHTVVLEANCGELVARHSILIIPLVKALEIGTTSTMRVVGTSDTLHVAAYTIDNVPMPSPPLRWSSSNPTVIAVTPDGSFSVRASGTATLSVSLYDTTTSIEILARPPYHVMALTGTGAGPRVVALNDSDAVLAYWNAGGGDAPFLHHAGRTDPISGCDTVFSVNDRDQVLCAAALGDSRQLAIWDHGTLAPVAGFAGIPSQARLNNLDAIAFITDSTRDAALCPVGRCLGLWKAGATTRLNPPGGPQTLLHFDDANNIGIGVADGPIYDQSLGGYFFDAAAQAWDGFEQPVIYDAETLSVTGINGRGVIVGSRWAYHGTTDGCFRPPHGTFGSGLPGPAAAINDDGEVVGWNLAANTPYLFELDGHFVAKLSDLMLDAKWTPLQPVTLSNRGTILATAKSTVDGHTATVLLQP